MLNKSYVSPDSKLCTSCDAPIKYGQLCDQCVVLDSVKWIVSPKVVVPDTVYPSFRQSSQGDTAPSGVDESASNA